MGMKDLCNLRDENGLKIFFPQPPFFFLNLFYWRIIALQNFIVFCLTSTWISHRYAYIPSLLNLPPISLPIPPLQVDTEPLFECPEPHSTSPLVSWPFWSSPFSLHCWPLCSFSYTNERSCLALGSINLKIQVYLFYLNNLFL